MTVQLRALVLHTVIPLLALAAALGEARAEPTKTLVIGLFVPTTPLGGQAEQLDFVSRLASHLEKGSDSVRVVGRAYSRASDFSAAVSKGEVQYAVADAPWVVSRSSSDIKVLGYLSRGGSTTVRWVIAAREPQRGLAELRGKTLAMPSPGARENDFLYRVLLEGEVGTGFLGSVRTTLDAASAVTSTQIGKADLAALPTSALESGEATRLVPVLQLREVPLPLVIHNLKAGASPLSEPTVAERLKTFVHERTQSRFVEKDKGELTHFIQSYLPRRPTAPILSPHDLDALELLPPAPIPDLSPQLDDRFEGRPSSG